MNVTNWMDDGKPPENPTIHDMRYGLGCMNDLTIIMADLFKELMIALGEPNRPNMNNPSKMIEDMDKATLGRLWGQFRLYYDNNEGLVSQSKVEHAISERNYFIHVFRNDNPTRDDGRRLFDLIRLLMKVDNQLINVSDNISKKKRTEQNINNDFTRKELIEIIRSCKQFESGKVYLSELGNVLSRQNIVLDKKLSEVIQEFGWKMYYYDRPGTETPWFVLVNEIK